jgi:hypothetical protein
MIILKVILTIALIIYILIGAIQAFVAVRGIWNPESRPPAKKAATDLVVRILNDRPKLAVVVQVLNLPAYSLAWPIFTRTVGPFIRRTSDRQWNARAALRPLYGQVSVALFVLVVVTTVLHNASLSWSPVLIAITWLVLIAVVCKEVSYLVSPLPDRLRQSSRPPWFSFLIVAAADALALTFAVANLRAPWEGGRITVSLVISSFADLFNVPGNVSDLMALTRSELLVAIIGFLYSTALVKTLVTPSHFNRTDDDYRRLAFASVATGNTADGVRWLSNEKESNAFSHRIRCQIALASGQLDRAAAAAGRYLVTKEHPDTKDNRIAVMGDVSIWVAMTDEEAVQFARYIITNASDWAVSALLPGLLVDYPDVSIAAAELVTEESGPLTYSRVVMMAQDEFGPATEVLERTKAGSDVEEVLRLLRLCVLHILSAGESISESDAHVRDWWRSSFPIVKELTAKLDSYEGLASMEALVELDVVLEIMDDEEFAQLHQEIHLLADDMTDSPELAEKFRSMMRKSIPV